MECRICGSKEYETVYQGIIRDGCFGKYTKETVSVYKCHKCGAMYHENVKGIGETFYESGKYREDMDETIDGYELLHDKEVLEKLQYTGTGIFRNKIIADIGCGGGSFLDFIQGAALEVIGIEPTEGFREKLCGKGYRAYAYMDDATIIIGTPTEQPMMRMALGKEYDRFLFSTQHLWVLNEKSLKFLAGLAGFKNIEVKYKQRYGLGNLISWIKNKKPMGNVGYEYISDSVDKNWIANSEERELADYIVMYAEK